MTQEELHAQLNAEPGSRLQRVQCRDCGLTLSAVSALALGDAVADHEATHGVHLHCDHASGELLVKT